MMRGNRVYCDREGCRKWTAYGSDKYDDWVNGGGYERTYDYCSETHRSEYETAHPNWMDES